MNSDGIADLDETIGLIYEAALDSELWPRVLERITHHAHGACTLLLALDPGSAQPIQQIADVFPGRDEYVAYYANIDPRNAYSTRLGAGDKLVDYDFITESQMRQSEFYQDFLLPHGLGYAAAGMLMRNAECIAGIAIQRSRRQGPFDIAEFDLLDRLTPHLNRALRLHTRFAALETQRWSDQALRDQLPFAVILLDERGRIVSQNRAAIDLLTAGDGVTARRGRLRARHPADQAALGAAISAAVTTAHGRSVDGGGTVALRRTSTRRPLGAFVMPVPPRGGAFTTDVGTSLPAALVILTDPETAPSSLAAVLRHLYGLTPAEAALAQTLAAGGSLREYADEAQVTYETARWRLKQILAKTGTHRQAELVRLVLSNAVLR